MFNFQRAFQLIMFLKYCFYSILLVAISILLKQCITLFNSDKIEVNVFPINSNELFTSHELAEFDGEKNPEKIYISILGHVFDVSKGREHYGPGNTYNVFTGCDASRSYVTGNFDKTKITDDIMNLSPNEIKSLYDWKEFYMKNYELKGKLIGRYFKSNGEPTEYSLQVQNILDTFLKLKANEDQTKISYPPCNIEWNAEKGTRVWCTSKSGGVERNWIGVPRKMFKPGLKSYRCACVKTEDLNKKHILEYENCNKESSSCYVNL